MRNLTPMLILLLLASAMYATAQENPLDSLETELEKAKTDTLRSSILISMAYASQTEEEQLKYAIQAYELGQKVSSPKHKNRSILALGIFYSPIDPDSAMALMKKGTQGYFDNELTKYAVNGNYIIGLTYEIANQLDTALKYYRKTYKMGLENNVSPEYGNAAYAIANINNIRGKNVEALSGLQKRKKRMKKRGLTQELSQSLNQIGIIYDQKGLYSEALDNYLKARDMAIQAGDIDGEILINNNIGVIYDNMNNSEMAMEYYSNALEKTRIHNLEANEATLLNNLSYVHLQNGDTAKAVSLLKNALEIDLSETYPCFESYPLEGMGDIYLNQNKLDSAEYFFDRALEVSNSCEEAVITSSVLKGLGKLYARQGKPSQAEVALERALQIGKDSELQLETKEALQALYQFHKSEGNSTKAMGYLEEYMTLTDSINKENNIEKASQLASEYDFRKQVAQMEQERMESEQKFAEEIQAKTYQNNLILLALVLFFLLAVTMGRSFYVIQKRNKKLRWLNDEKNKLMGIVAHDLRNPLNMIIGLMPLFQDVVNKNKDKTLEKYVELLGASSERMRDMIDRVLDISAIENMKVNLKLEKTNLSELTYNSIHNFDVIASQKQISIVDNIDKSNERYANVDPNYLVQVIDNLLSNAIKFSDRGKKIEVSLLSENNHHEIIVKDEGPGISTEEQESLFKAYTTLSSKPTEHERSTGLGLSIAYKFVKAMGGEIKCQSTLGEGTTFNLIFDKA